MIARGKRPANFAFQPTPRTARLKVSVRRTESQWH